MTATRPIGLPWNYPLFGEPNRSIFAPPRYRLQRRPLAPAPQAVPPLSLDEVVLHLRLDPEAKDGPEKLLLEGMIAAAARHLEDYAGITLLHTGWRMTMRHWPPVWNMPLDLPMPPFHQLLRIEVAGEDLDINEFLVEDDETMAARLYPKSGFWRWAWSPTPAMIVINWIAGHEKPDEIPSPLRLAMLMAIGHWYENRETSQQFQLYPIVELGWQSLLTAYRDVGFA